MNDPKFEYHPEAISEAAEAYRWYFERSEKAAEGFWQELHRARQLVTGQPESWNPYFHGTRCFRLHRYPFGLVYVQRSNLIFGLAVAHLKRRPGYWRDRMTP